MDLRSVLNTSDNGDRAPPKAPPTPQQQTQPRPSDSPAQYGYREYGPPQPHPSPGKAVSQDYGHPHQPGASYMPPSPYQAPGPYPGRPQPPPLQSTNSFHDVRSPSGAMPAPSPYRSAPSTVAPGAAPGFPFPPAQQVPEVTSPVQRHQYPPAQYQHQRRDSYSQGVAAQAPAPYMQQHPVPQTPPVGTPGGSHPYPHQRSMSTHSTPTPTSAHSQHQYGPPYAQASPVAKNHPPPGEYSRQPSQPPTPLGPPPGAVSRQPSVAGSYAQPPSPYQQRVSSIATAHVAQAVSPHHPPPLVQRMSSMHSIHDSSGADGHLRSQSHSSRGQSLSVSPKTRIPSLPSSADRLATAAELDARGAPPVQPMLIDSIMAVTPAKRKLEDRDLSPKDLDQREARPPPGEVNGGHVPTHGRAARVSSSPIMARKKRLRHAQPPAWAQSVHTLGKKMPSNANFVLQKRVHSHLNGKQDGAGRSGRVSRNTSPEATRVQAGPQGRAPEAPPAETGPQEVLGPWEASIIGVKPYEEMSKSVADFLFIHVIKSPDYQEIRSRDILFEVEAKLGTLIDKDTNHRVQRGLDSECILRDNQRTAFRSSMTEVHHKAFNDFLNHVVIQTDPRAPHGGHRVQVHYKHRREIDRFFELSPDLQARLPGCVRSRLGRNKNVRARVTYDQKTGGVLNKIIKARVADIDVHMPTCPMDCRISINLEVNWEGSVEELEGQLVGQSERNPDRNKDRLSYTQGSYQIDLTQVTHVVSAPGGPQRVEKEHELEIELDSEALIAQGQKAMNGEVHKYQELVEGLVDNVRVLARKARDFSN